MMGVSWQANHISIKGGIRQRPLAIPGIYFPEFKSANDTINESTGLPDNYRSGDPCALGIIQFKTILPVSYRLFNDDRLSNQILIYVHSCPHR